jgi:hypothetical protein
MAAALSDPHRMLSSDPQTSTEASCALDFLSHFCYTSNGASFVGVVFVISNILPKKEALLQRFSLIFSGFSYF